MPGIGHATAPRFDPEHPRALRRFFSVLDRSLARSDIIDVDEKKFYACLYLDIDSADLWESLPEYSDSDNWDAFKIAIFKLYPGAEDERKFSIADMDKLVKDTAQSGLKTDKAYGEYNRAFLSITNFLLAKNRLAQSEQSRAFVRGFPPHLWSKIHRRLELKLPDHYPDDPYALSDIHAAAQFVLHGTSSAFDNRATADTTVKSEDIQSFMAFLTAITPHVPTALSPVRSGPHRPITQSQKSSSQSDLLCSDSPAMSAASTMMYTLSPAPIESHAAISDLAIESHTPIASHTPIESLMTESIIGDASNLSVEQRTVYLEQELFALRSGKRYEGPDGTRSRQVPVLATPFVNRPTLPIATMPLLRSIAPATPTMTSETQLSQSPPLPNYLPPQERNFATSAPSKVAPESKEVAFRSVTPIQSDKIADDVYARAMTAPCVEIAPQELLLLSPEIQSQIHEVIAPKQIKEPIIATLALAVVETAIILEPDPLPFASDPLISTALLEIYSHLLSPSQGSDPFIIAKDTLSLRSIAISCSDPDRTAMFPPIARGHHRRKKPPDMLACSPSMI